MPQSGDSDLGDDHAPAVAAAQQARKDARYLRWLWPTLANPILANLFLAKIRGLWLVVWPLLVNQILANLFWANPFL